MGLIPAWSKNELYGSKMINARLETVTTKPSFKNLIPKIDALFYPMDITNGNKVASEKNLFHSKKWWRLIFLQVCGLPGPPSKRIFTYTILTTKAQKDISAIHDRMPVLFDKSKAGNVD